MSAFEKPSLREGRQKTSLAARIGYGFDIVPRKRKLSLIPSESTSACSLRNVQVEKTRRVLPCCPIPFSGRGGVLDLKHSANCRRSLTRSGSRITSLPWNDVESVSILAASDVFCLPSRSEGFSNALIEAMGSRLPCVATRVGGKWRGPDRGRRRLLVESEDADAMGDRLLRLLRDPKLRQGMGLAARKTVESQFSMSAMMARLAGIYGNSWRQRMSNFYKQPR